MFWKKKSSELSCCGLLVVSALKALGIYLAVLGARLQFMSHDWLSAEALLAYLAGVIVFSYGMRICCTAQK